MTSPACDVPPTIRQPPPEAPAYPRPTLDWRDGGAGCWLLAEIGRRLRYCCQRCGKRGLGDGYASGPATFTGLHEPTCPLTAEARATLVAVGVQVEAPPSVPTLPAGVLPDGADDAVPYDYAAPWRALEAAEAVPDERRRLRDWPTAALVEELMRRGMRLAWAGPVGPA
jgi:hypothetical protein